MAGFWGVGGSNYLENQLIIVYLHSGSKTYYSRITVKKDLQVLNPCGAQRRPTSEREALVDPWPELQRSIEPLPKIRNNVAVSVNWESFS